jgi:hypothetical protein
MGGREFLKAVLRREAQPLVIRQMIMAKIVKRLKRKMRAKDLIIMEFSLLGKIDGLIYCQSSYVVKKIIRGCLTCNSP